MPGGAWSISRCDAKISVISGLGLGHGVSTCKDVLLLPAIGSSEFEMDLV